MSSFEFGSDEDRSGPRWILALQDPEKLLGSPSNGTEERGLQKSLKKQNLDAGKKELEMMTKLVS